MKQKKRYSPQSLYEMLREVVVGQDDYLKKLAMTFWLHDQRLKADEIMPSSFGVPKQNLLVIGPTGSGKTLALKTLVDLFDFDMVIEDASAFTGNGWKGREVTEMIEDLYIECGKDKARTQRGIIVLDELDKALLQKDSKNDSFAVENSLLKLIEGMVVDIEPDKSAIQIDTKNILFIGAGAFEGIEDYVKEKQAIPKTIGFLGNVEISKEEKNDNIFSMITKEDLVRYGAGRQLLGRFSEFAYLNKLGVEDLENILRKSKASPLRGLSDTLRMTCGVKVSIDEAGIHAVAKKAVDEGTGARGLSQIIMPKVNEAIFDLPDEVNEIVVSASDKEITIKLHEGERQRRFAECSENATLYTFPNPRRTNVERFSWRLLQGYLTEFTLPYKEIMALHNLLCSMVFYILEDCPVTDRNMYSLLNLSKHSTPEEHCKDSVLQFLVEKSVSVKAKAYYRAYKELDSEYKIASTIKKAIEWFDRSPVRLLKKN